MSKSIHTLERSTFPVLSEPFLVDSNYEYVKGGSLCSSLSSTTADVSLQNLAKVSSTPPARTLLSRTDALAPTTRRVRRRVLCQEPHHRRLGRHQEGQSQLRVMSGRRGSAASPTGGGTAERAAAGDRTRSV
mgnify:CR=1 FL=1